MQTGRHWMHRFALALALVLVVGVPSVSRAQVATPSCSATYERTAQFTGGFLATVTVKNTGTVPTKSWVVRWRYLDGQTVYQTTSSTFVQSGADFKLMNVFWNGAIQPGAVQFGGMYIQGYWKTVNSQPVDITCTAY